MKDALIFFKDDAMLTLSILSMCFSYVLIWSELSWKVVDIPSSQCFSTMYG